ncbi:hypothetical protein [Roseisolibacter sp. H3M3-2]|uniref:hypothetical protein n=1 Tax=Roseisolibacter sp. H3M3-2 TaxID=3031323 RepID=UPI0023DB6788|nr:hypothetical protein [Roseisolibacter sp. H3M3-2]MDF1505632.1 hypothetical protein [Roseisolibacter sp. H3M3-2]
MTNAGAMVAIMAAARARRVQEVMDAFRLAGATAPERARTLTALGVVHDAELATLAEEGVVVQGPQPGTWYLSEPAVVARRDRRPTRAVWLVVAVLFALTAVLVGVLVATRNSQ